MDNLNFMCKQNFNGKVRKKHEWKYVLESTFLVTSLHLVQATADFIKKVLSVYTHSVTTIYLSLSAQVAKSTFFMKSPVAEGSFTPIRLVMGRHRKVSAVVLLNIMYYGIRG